jgi:hypothetical protein
MVMRGALADHRLRDIERRFRLVIDEVVFEGEDISVTQTGRYRSSSQVACQ